MDFKQLNESLQKFLEGDVVSFTDFKRNKMARQRKERSAQFIQDYEKELNKSLENKVFVEIQKIKVVWAEGRIDGVNSFKGGEELSYEEFQKRAYEYNYALKDRIGQDKVKITVYFNYHDTNTNEDDQYNMRVYIGGDKNLTYKEVNVMYLLQRAWKESLQGKELIFTNDEVYPDVNDNSLQYAVLEEPEKEEEKEYIKIDYSNKNTKTAQEVEVGDIIYTVWGYSMVLVDFYQVAERKKASIKLEKLQTVIVDGDGMQGTSAPIDKPDERNDIDGKLFRIGTKYDKKAVCQINGHTAYYYDGEPKSFDHMD